MRNNILACCSSVLLDITGNSTGPVVHSSLTTKQIGLLGTSVITSI